MKTLFRVLTIIVASLTISLTTQAQVKFGVKGGLNASSIAGMEKFLKLGNEAGGFGYDKIETSYKLGFHAGLMAQIDLPGTNVFFQPELLYSAQGVDAEADGESDNVSLGYLQLPIYVGYKFNAGLGLDVIVGVGPYLAYGIYGNDDYFDTFKRFDFGFSAMGGIQFNDLQITIGYDLGVINAADMDGWSDMKDAFDLSNICNRNFKVSVGYFF